MKKKCVMCVTKMLRSTGKQVRGSGFVVCKECRVVPLSVSNTNCRVCDREISIEEDNRYEGLCEDCYKAEQDEYYANKEADAAYKEEVLW